MVAPHELQVTDLAAGGFSAGLPSPATTGLLSAGGGGGVGFVTVFPFRLLSKNRNAETPTAARAATAMYNCV